MDKSDIWFASLSSWAGIVGGATHWLVTLHGPSRTVTVEWYIDLATAILWNRRDPSYRFEEGDGSNRFNSEAEAERAAIVVFERIADPASDLLVRGSRSVRPPEKALAGCPEHVERLTEAVAQMEVLGWWDVPNNRKAADRVAESWEAYERENFNEHWMPSVYGYKAPDGLVQSEEYAWGTPKPEEEIDYSVPLVVPPGYR